MNEREVLLLPIDKVIPDPLQPRRRIKKDGLDLLRSSIQRDGVMNPLSVKPSPTHETDGTYILVTGERRWRCCVALGHATVPCFVMPDTIDAYLWAVIDNLAREDLNPMDEAYAYDQLCQRGMKQADVAKHVARSVPHISLRLSLLRLPERLQDEVADKLLNPSVACHLLRRCTDQADMLTVYDEVRFRSHGRTRITVAALDKYFAEREIGQLVANAGGTMDPAVFVGDVDEVDDDDDEVVASSDEPPDSAQRGDKKPGHIPDSQGSSRINLGFRAEAGRPHLPTQPNDGADRQIGRLTTAVDAARKNGLPGNWPSRLLDMGLSKWFSRRTCVYRQGEPATHVYIIMSGKFMRVAEEAMVAVDIHGSGELFGVAIRDGRYTETLYVQMSGAVLVIPKDHFVRFVCGNATTNELLLAHLGERAQRDFHRIVLSHTTVDTRICYLLHDLALRFGAEGDVRGRAVNLGLTRRQLAQMAATALETVIRCLGRLRRRGLINLDDKMVRTYFVPDMDKLRFGT